ncbi:MAG: alpha/beta hydrolase [Burkholderiales bacterium]|nr:alpha/beta hydrolase [Burkholderiales bacterium]
MTAGASTPAGEPRLRRVQCLDARGLHRLAYWEWGDPANRRVLVCAHGVSRQGRDFDVLARAMQGEFRVVCPDVVGRGESDRLADPAGYVLPTYLADMVTLLARLDADSVAWLGTSMGGLIGMGLASLPGSPIGRLVVNDIGPSFDAAGIARIGSYLGMPIDWASEDEAADYLLTISQGFGPHSREEWLALTRPMLRRKGERLHLHYDPAIALPMRAITPEIATAGQAALWAAYDAIRCPTLLLRGAASDILARATAEEMTRRGPKPRLHEFAGIGHAPTLVAPGQVAVVREFLLSP